MHALGFVYACLLGGRSKWRCFQETFGKAPRVLMGFRRWNDYAGIYFIIIFQYKLITTNI